MSSSSSSSSATTYSSVALTICEEIAGYLREQGEASAIAVPFVEIDLSKVRSRQIYVQPGPVTVTPITRGDDEHRLDICIAIADRSEDGSMDEQLDCLKNITDAVSRLETEHGVVVAVKPEYDLDNFRRERIFTGAVNVSVWVEP